MPLRGGAVNNHTGIGGADGRPARPPPQGLPGRMDWEGGPHTPAPQSVWPRAARRDLGSSVLTLLGGSRLSRCAPSTKPWWPDSVRLGEVR